MMENQSSNFSKLRIKIILSTIAVILLAPVAAMQFTTEVNWTLTDFIAAAVLLLSTGFAIEMVMRKVKTPRAKTILLVIILLTLFLIWAELAVGIFGSPIAGS